MGGCGVTPHPPDLIYQKQACKKGWLPVQVFEYFKKNAATCLNENIEELV